MRLTVVCLTIFSVVCFSAFSVWGKTPNWNTIGVRGGIGGDRNNESFSQYEIYGTYSLPWKWEAESNWTLGSFTGVNLGYLTCEGDTFVGSIGLGLYIKTPGRRVVLSAGVYPTYLGKSEFGDDDFGGSFQFTSAVGLNYIFFDSWTIGYRFQHMSNAGLADNNPGLNTHMVEVGYHF